MAQGNAGNAGNQGNNNQLPCSTCHLVGGTVLSGAGLRNLYYARTAVQHKVWLLCSGGGLLAAGIIYGLYPAFTEGSQDQI